MMQYKGYLGEIELDEEAAFFHGRVAGTRDVITFQGRTAAEIVKAFHDSIDDYLAFCAERGEQPEKPYSGKFVTRISPDLHRRAALAAKSARTSLNEWIRLKLESSLTGQPAANASKTRKSTRATAADRAKESRRTAK
jgi:predicted HicB family RNase H-like nuclease